VSSPRTAGVVAAWLVAVAAATLVGMAAVGAIGSGISDRGPRPLGQAEISERLGTSATAPPPATSTTTTAPTTTQTVPAAAPEVINTGGGTVLVRCTPDVEIVSATPAQGYRVEDIEPNDGGQRVRFRSGGTRVEIRIHCRGGEPQAQVRTD
jgi:hypothetical protein